MTLIETVRSIEGAEDALREYALIHNGHEVGPWDWDCYCGLDDIEAEVIIIGYAGRIIAESGPEKYQITRSPYGKWDVLSTLPPTRSITFVQKSVATYTHACLALIVASAS